MTDSGADSDVEMLAEEFERSILVPATMDDVFGAVAESEDEYHSFRYRVHTCFCRSEGCISCSVRDCPHHDVDHYHHDGCASCCPSLRPQLTIGAVRQEGPITFVDFAWSNGNRNSE